MALTPSNMLPLGTVAPDFSLPDGAGQIYSLPDCKKEKGILVAFICNHCPFVIHIKPQLAEMGRQLAAKGIGMVAISTNDVENFPADSPEKMLEDAQAFGYEFPYLYDESQEIAKAYDAACTPDFYLFDADLKLVYRGQFDSSRPSNDVPVTGEDIYSAVEALLAGEMIENQLPSIGCNIKWKQ